MRSSGILLPVSALPSRYGIGTIGREAFEFVDFLERCGQRFWQILPVGPTGYGDSPYQSFSAHAGNPYLIDLEALAADGLLTVEEIEASGFVENPDLIDYGDLYDKRFTLLKKAAKRIGMKDRGLLTFCEENSEWLPDYALFMTLKSEYGMESFQSWPDEYRLYKEERLKAARRRNKRKMHFWNVLQYLFYRQWAELKKYANGKGIKIIGDIPIYVSSDSSDLWANHKLFQVDRNRNMTSIAGCPPDYFNEDGQRWGNPLYNWNAHKKQDYDWWMKRLKNAESVFDAVRIDHFRGFAGYYSIPVENETAREGEWRKGPGKKFISKIKEEFPDFMIIAEDLGLLTPDVRRLLKFSGFPGMKVLQFAFHGGPDNEYLPGQHIENCVVYTGTHDNPTLSGWVKTAPFHEIKSAKRYLGVDRRLNLTGAFVKAAMHSVGNICIIPMQDWLGLGNDARINTPATTMGNWRFRVRKEKLSKRLTRKILTVTKDSGRS